MKKFDLLIIFIVVFIELTFTIIAFNKYSSNTNNERFVEIKVQNQVILKEKLTEGLEKKYLVLSKDNVFDKIVNVELDYIIPNDLEGYDLVYIYDNGVQVIDADCPNRIIVTMGFTNHIFKSLICAPRKIVVSIID